MANLVYYLTIPILYLISWLPFFVLRGIANLMYLLIYRIAGYRKKVVRANLVNSFPEKSITEIKRIEADFYLYFCDLILETIKTLTISGAMVKKHLTYGEMSVFKEYFEKQQSVIIVMGHLGNWELAGARFSQDPYHQLYVIYHPLVNKKFDQLLYHMRTRLGNKLYAMKDSFRGMIKNKGTVTATAFIADQTPSNPKHAYWTDFLNQETPVFEGTAKIAKKLGYPVIYVSVKRLKRSYYEISGELLVHDPKRLTEEEISELHTRKLEQDISLLPATWLWTHRRWKHKRPEK